MDYILIEGKNYISSKRAAEIMGYTQDYVGQLCRAGKMRAERISGVWYVSEDEFSSQKKINDTIMSFSVLDEKSNKINVKNERRALILDGNEFISSKRAAEIMGYTQDYVGQLCRAGKINARQVGKGWYIPSSVVYATSKKTESKDIIVEVSTTPLLKEEAIEPEIEELDVQPVVQIAPTKYVKDNNPLIPEPKRLRHPVLHEILEDKEEVSHSRDIPIRRVPMGVMRIPSYERIRPPRPHREPVISISNEKYYEEYAPSFFLKPIIVGICTLVLALSLNAVPHRLVFNAENRSVSTVFLSGGSPSSGLASVSSESSFLEKFFSFAIGIFENEIEYKAN